LEQIVAQGVGGESDVGALATRAADGSVAMLVWNYHDDDVPGLAAAIRFTIKGVKKGNARTATVWRVDHDNGNAFTAWQRMGSPQSPNADQYKLLEQASEMIPQTVKPQSASGNTATLDLSLPRQGVALVVLSGK
jgi:xylan 1,4-beta-xylosidase